MTALSESGRAAAAYLRILNAIGDRVDQLGPDREVVAHWPFVGTRFNGLLIAGQALDGWDAEVTPARWRLDALRDPGNRGSLLRGAQEWATHRSEPMDEVLLRGKRSRSPFWDVTGRIVAAIEPAGGNPSPWYARCAWFNVYPIAPRRGSPEGLLKDLQASLVGDLFWAVVDELGVDRIVLLPGKDWWWDVRARLGLEGLDTRQTSPVIAAGRLRNVSVVYSYHPGAHLRGPRSAFAAGVRDALERQAPGTSS
ncbi:MAG TPA: hypothetical protein VF494_00905 [Candidatus Limnocylindrales bacterium]